MLLLQSTAARAATVVIVGPVNGPPVMVETLVRLKGELTSAGFDVQIVDASPVGSNADGTSRSALEQLASRRSADAVVAMVGGPSNPDAPSSSDRARDTNAGGGGGPDSVEVWVIDKVTGKSVVRRVPFEPTSAGASKTLAIRAIELLRSSFLEIDLAARARQSDPSVPPPRPPAAVIKLVDMGRGAPARAERIGVEVGGAAVMGVDGIGPALLPLVRVGWAARSWLIAEATLAGLGTRPAVTTEAGSAEVAQAYALAGGAVRLRDSSDWRPFIAFSVGGLRTSVAGRANPPNEGHAVGQWSFLVDLGFGVAIHLPDRFYLSFGADAQLAEPYVRLRFADAIVATSARPNLLVTATVGAWL